MYFLYLVILCFVFELHTWVAQIIPTKHSLYDLTLRESCSETFALSL